MANSISNYEIIRISYPDISHIQEPVLQIAEDIHTYSQNLAINLGLDKCVPYRLQKGRIIGKPRALSIQRASIDRIDAVGQMSVAALKAGRGLYLDEQHNNPIDGFRFRKLEIFDIDAPLLIVRNRHLNDTTLHKFGRLAFGFRLFNPIRDDVPSWCPVEITIPSNEPNIAYLQEFPVELDHHIEKAAETLKSLCATIT